MSSNYVDRTGLTRIRKCQTGKFLTANRDNSPLIDDDARFGTGASLCQDTRTIGAEASKESWDRMNTDDRVVLAVDLQHGNQLQHHKSVDTGNAM
jgi:hypothetical protein